MTWQATVKTGAVFEAESLKALACQMGEFYADNDLLLPTITNIHHVEKERDFPGAALAVETVAERAYQQFANDSAEAAYDERMLRSSRYN